MVTKRKPRKRRGNNTPDYVLKMRSKDSDTKGWARVGVAWEGDNGVSIRLNRGMVLDWHDYADEGAYTLMMFPYEESE